MDPRRGTDRYDGGATGISDVKYVRGVFFALITVSAARGGQAGARPAELPVGV